MYVYNIGVCIYVSRAVLVSLHSFVPLEEELLEAAALEDLYSLVRHLSHGGQFHTLQKCLVVRNRHQGALVRRQELSKPHLEKGQGRDKIRQYEIGLRHDTTRQVETR